MSNTITSINMLLPIPVVGVDPGPDYALNVDACLALIDSHNHSANQGVQIMPSGLNINSDLSFNYNSAFDLYSADFIPHGSPISGNATLYFSGQDLWVNDVAGTHIQITAFGGVNGSPGSIGGLVSPASATYTSGSKQFNWLSGVGKYAAMANGAVSIFQTDTSSSYSTTLVASPSQSGNYQLTLPVSAPASTEYMASNSSGVLSFVTADSIGQAMTSVGADSIGQAMTSVGADAVAASMDSTGVNSIINTYNLFPPTTGTYIPAIGLNGGSATGITATGYYTQIGNVIFIYIYYVWTQTVAPSSLLTMTIPTAISSALRGQPMLATLTGAGLDHSPQIGTLLKTAPTLPIYGWSCDNLFNAGGSIAVGNQYTFQLSGSYLTQ